MRRGETIETPEDVLLDVDAFRCSFNHELEILAFACLGIMRCAEYAFTDLQHFFRRKDPALRSIQLAFNSLQSLLHNLVRDVEQTDRKAALRVGLCEAGAHRPCPDDQKLYVIPGWFHQSGHPSTMSAPPCPPPMQALAKPRPPSSSN